MQTTNKGGDVLARGGSRCQFAPMGGNVSQQKWDNMWKNDDEQNSGDSDSSQDRDTGSNPGETVPSTETA